MSDEILTEIVELVYGSGSELISKMNPAQSDLATKDKKKRAFTAGLSAVGATAGAAGLALGGHNISRSYKLARSGSKVASAGKHVARAGKHAGFAKPMTRRAALKHAVGQEKLATGLIPLEVAGLGGEVMATRILHNDTKKKTVSKGYLIKKDLGDLLNNSSDVPSKKSMTRAMLKSSNRKKAYEYTKKTHGKLKRFPDKPVTTNEVEKALKTRSRAESIAGHAAIGAGATALPATLATWNKSSKAHAAALAGGALVGAGYGALKPVTHPKTKGPSKKVAKRDEIDVIWNAEISKADADKQQIFGWASVVEVNGEPVVDLQGDHISVDEMEKAGYEYVMKSRKGGDMHLRDNWSPIQKSEMIESFIVTPEKRDAMGLPDSVPTGWWVGFKVQDPDVWSKVKSGERTGFSIHGHGRRSDG